MLNTSHAPGKQKNLKKIINTIGFELAVSNLMAQQA